MEKLKGNWFKDRLLTNWQSTLTAVGIGALAALQELAGTNTKYAGYAGLGALLLAKVLGKDTGSAKPSDPLDTK
jgi:hypothetical protein